MRTSNVSYESSHVLRDSEMQHMLIDRSISHHGNSMFWQQSVKVVDDTTVIHHDCDSKPAGDESSWYG